MTESAGITPARMDVSHLPESAFDARTPVWWGNTLAIFIETTSVALLVASYFYLRRNFESWPPPQVNREPVEYRPLPNILIPTIELALMAGSCLAMYVTDMAARKLNKSGVLMGLLLMFIVAGAMIGMRFYDFPGTHFKWNDNAYASIVWTLLGTHLTYLLAAAAEFLIMGVWIATHPLDEPHAEDVTLAGGYWYWATGTWVVIYAVVYIGARVL